MTSSVINISPDNAKSRSGLRRKRSPAGLITRGVTAMAFAAVTLCATATAAQADSWAGGCTGLGNGTCVHATVGSKNFGNHTQWVGWVYGNVYNSAGITKLEVWGDGFYFATGVNPQTTSPVSPVWGAQRWVRSGTNVCAASTDLSGHRDIACIGIRV